MIITRTPYRISFFGGGTDYPGWYLKHGGQVLSTTIDKYLYISCRYLPPFFEHRLRLVYSRIEECQHSSALDHPSAKEVLKFLGIENGLEIHYDGDLPGRSGLGSSSSFTVGLLNALYAYLDQTVSNHRLSTESIHIEQDLINETVGSQDQVNAAYGGLNKIRFKQSGEIIVDPITLPKERLEALDQNLMLLYRYYPHCRKGGQELCNGYRGQRETAGPYACYGGSGHGPYEKWGPGRFWAAPE